MGNFHGRLFYLKNYSSSIIQKKSFMKIQETQQALCLHNHNVKASLPHSWNGWDQEGPSARKKMISWSGHSNGRSHRLNEHEISYVMLRGQTSKVWFPDWMCSGKGEGWTRAVVSIHSVPDLKHGYHIPFLIKFIKIIFSIDKVQNVQMQYHNCFHL